ncbi:hypothetical protein [Aquimarina longa]|uniref:hypothetical protein n=1 Tax=Aquimarina longa TaxID=1080221 RepID=UPI0007841501|nr:hypothetical protein [Aquimarina longa]
MDFYKELSKVKKEKNYTYSILGKAINMKGATFKQAFYRESLNDLQKRELSIVFKLGNSEDLLNLNEKEINAKIKKFSDFFVEYENRVLQDAVINNIIEKRVAKRLFEITRNEEELKKFLNS